MKQKFKPIKNRFNNELYYRLNRQFISQLSGQIRGHIMVQLDHLWRLQVETRGVIHDETEV